MSKNPSLAERLRDAEVYEEFCDLMFAQEVDYQTLLTDHLDKWGISSSMGALSRFRDSEYSHYTIDRAKRHCESLLNDPAVNLDEAGKRMVAERLFNLAASPNVSEKSLLKMRELEIRAEMLKQDGVKLEHAERKLALLEAKLGKADEAMDDQKLTAEEKVIRWKQIFGR